MISADPQTSADTKEQRVVAICKQMIAEGQNPTVATVLKRLIATGSGGSNREIGPMVARFKADKKTQASDYIPPMPVELIQPAFQALWTESCVLTAARFDEERAQLKAEIESLKDEQKIQQELTDHHERVSQQLNDDLQAASETNNQLQTNLEAITAERDTFAQCLTDLRLQTIGGELGSLAITDIPAEIILQLDVKTAENEKTNKTLLQKVEAIKQVEIIRDQFKADLNSARNNESQLTIALATCQANLDNAQSNLAAATAREATQAEQHQQLISQLRSGG